MSEKIGLKLEIFPDLEAKKTLDGQSRVCNWLYNHLLELSKELKKQYIKSQDSQVSLILYTKRGLRNLLPSLKEKKPFLKVVHSSVLKNSALRLSESIQAHQKSKKGKRKGKKVGWPKFRSWKRSWFSLFYDEPDKGFKIEGQNLILSLGLGEDRKQRTVTLYLPEAALLTEKEIRNLRIFCEEDRYYAVFTVVKEIPVAKPISKIIAFDPNHKNLAYGVDQNGTAIEIPAPTWLKTHDIHIDELKSLRDHCKKKMKKVPVLDDKGKATGKEYYLSSRRWKKYNKALQKAYHKRREQTKTFMYTCAHRLFQEYDCVVMGDYTPHGNGITTPMRRAINNRSLIGRSKEIFSWVARKTGKTFFEFDEKGTTRTCNQCEFVVEGGIPLNIRQWECPCCKTDHIRDENAARNGLLKVLRDLRKNGEAPLLQVSGSDLAPTKERWTWRVLASGVEITPWRPKQQKSFCSAKKLNRGRCSSRSKVSQ